MSMKILAKIKVQGCKDVCVCVRVCARTLARSLAVSLTSCRGAPMPQKGGGC